MILTKQKLPISKITATTLPGKNGLEPKAGYSIGGVWLNGYSQADYPTVEDVHAALMGKELSPSATGKSLVVVGDYTPIERDTDLLSSILTPRAAQVNVEALNLNDLI